MDAVAKRDHRHRVAGVAALVLAAAALLTRWTVRDSVWPVSAFFYATPCWVVLGATAAAWRLLKQSPRLREAAGVAAAMTACWCVGKDVRPFAEAAGGRADFRVVHWNGMGIHDDPERAAAVLRSLDADVICLVEAGGRSPGRQAFWAEQLPEHEGVFFGHSFVILTKHPAEMISEPFVRPEGAHVEAALTIAGRRVHFVLVHPLSNPVYDRTRVMRLLAARAAELRGTPAVLTGDFNLPSDSAHFDAVRKDYALASDAAGPMLRPTWPSVLPLLTLDQVWVGGGLEAAGCRHVWDWYSDHRPVVTDLRIAN